MNPTHPTAADVLRQAREALAYLLPLAEMQPADVEPDRHLMQGDCPDETQPSSRDSECPACQKMVAAAELIAAIDALLSAPAGKINVLLPDGDGRAVEVLFVERLADGSANVCITAESAKRPSAPAVAWHMRVIGCDGSADWCELGVGHPEVPAGVEALPLVYAQASAPSGEPADVADALRYRWLTADHDDPAQRQCARDITERMAVMSYASVSASIDAAMTLGGEDADRATTAPAPQPAVRCELVESCRKCRHSVGRQSCALAGRDFDGAGIPAWCPLPVYGTAL